jgi:hypothetical protein
VDDDWKRSAREEARKLDAGGPGPGSAGAKGAGREAARPAAQPSGFADVESGEGAEGEPLGASPPEASFASLVSGFATQALLNLGQIASPFSGKAELDLEAARYTIDLLGVLEEKTRGNLSEQEARYLGAVLYDLRMRFVEAAKAPQGAPDGEAAGGVGEAPGGEGSPKPN